jgi:2-methylcitrate dehydratase PrpD
LLEAFVAGREVRMSLDPLFANRFAGAGPGARGWHANGILGPIGAACSAVKILGLGTAQTVNAIGLAAGSCGALGRDGGTMAKPFRAGHAAAAGVTCALLAQDGFTADTESLEGPYGLLSALGPVDQEVVNALAHNLGVEFSLAKHGIKVKKYAAANATHAPVEAMLRLLQKRPLSPIEVERIECDLKPYPLLRLSPENGHEGKFSMAYCLAVALLHRRLNPEDFSDAVANGRELKDLIRTVHHRPEEKSLTVVLKDGEEITEPVPPIRDLQTWDEVVHKFDECTSRVFTDAQCASIVDRVANLEELPSVKLLTEALRT